MLGLNFLRSPYPWEIFSSIVLLLINLHLSRSHDQPDVSTKKESGSWVVLHLYVSYMQYAYRRTLPHNHPCKFYDDFLLYSAVYLDWCRLSKKTSNIWGILPLVTIHMHISTGAHGPPRFPFTPKHSLVEAAANQGCRPNSTSNIQHSNWIHDFHAPWSTSTSISIFISTRKYAMAARRRQSQRARTHANHNITTFALWPFCPSYVRTKPTGCSR